MFPFLPLPSNQNPLQSPSLQVSRPMSCSKTRLPRLHWQQDQASRWLPKDREKGVQSLLTA